MNIVFFRSEKSQFIVNNILKLHDVAVSFEIPC